MLALALPATLATCAQPMTRMGTVSADRVRSEQATQLQLALEGRMIREARIDRVAYPLLRGAVPLCGAQVARRAGMRFGNAPLYTGQWQAAARANGLTDTATITAVAPGSGAERAGLAPGDRVLALDGVPVAPGPRAVGELATSLAKRERDQSESVRIEYRRDGAVRSADVPLDRVCAYTVQLDAGDALNAYADGRNVFATAGLMRFVQDDDELAVVLGHEIAHNAMRHIDARKTNAFLGALFGALVDVAVATQGINTQGEFAKQGATLGSVIFSQDFEREADYVGLYILALAGRPTAGASRLWRRMAQEDPKSIQFAFTHPTTAERFVRLEQWQAEIAQKVAAGAPLRPEMRAGATALAARGPRAGGNVGGGAVGLRAPARPPQQKPEAPAAVSDSARTPADAQPRPATRTAAVGGDVAPPVRQPPPVTQPQPERRARSRTVDPAPGADNGRNVGRAVIGAPASESDRAAAPRHFEAGNVYMARHEWGKAEASFREALRLDGSVAAYHAALGSVLVVLERWAEAEAAYTAALLLDVDNAEYRRAIKEIRARP